MAVSPISSSSTPGALLAKLRCEKPLVQCITNYVAMNGAANVLLAAGASPAMVHAEAEAAEFVRLAAALTINIGTLSPPWIGGMRGAAQAACANSKPWVLDPVAHFISDFRRDAVAELIAQSPTIIRGNASEIIALAGQTSRGSGVDSGDPVTAAEAAARVLACRYRTVIVVTGEIDFVTDGVRASRIHGGSPLMSQVTALGCSLTALIGAFAAICPDDALTASLAALALFAIAGERAAQLAAGPGSFAWQFLDALAAITPEALDAEMRITKL